jgi:hypothetical protein
MHFKASTVTWNGGGGPARALPHGGRRRRGPWPTTRGRHPAGSGPATAGVCGAWAASFDEEQVREREWVRVILSKQDIFKI